MKSPTPSAAPAQANEERFDVPVEIGKGARAALWLFVAVMGFLLAWASLAELSQGAVATGEVAPQSRSKTVQHLEGGIIRTISVRDGDAVKHGQLLMTLDDSEARAAVAIAETERATLFALVERLTAERDGKLYLAQPGDLNPAISAQRRIFDFRRQSMRREIGSLVARIRQLEQELQAWSHRSSSLAQLNANATEEQKQNQQLFEQNYISRARLLALENQNAQTRATQGETDAEIARTQQRITDTRLQISKLRNDWMNALLDELRRAQDGLAAATEKTRVAHDRLARTRILSPETGVVKGLKTTTLGAVIPPGGLVLEIVPVTDTMLVEARINPDDIDAVKIGGICRVNITAYKARSQLSMQGVVRKVSAATFQDDTATPSYYTAQIEISQNDAAQKKGITLQPGLLAEVIFTGSTRTPMRYLFDPILQSFGRAFKEE